MEPLANGVHAVRLAPQGVESAVVIGAGTIGLVTLQAALLDGIPHVAVVEPQDERRARAPALGAHAAYGSPEEARDAGEPDLVLDAVGAQATRALGLELLRPGGTMVCIGLADDDTTLGFHDVVRSQHRIQGSYAYTMPDFEQAHEWLVSGQASLGDDLTAVRPLEDGPEQFARLAGRPAAARVQGLPGRREARIVVIGASCGIGLATARAFVAAGDTVHAAARREIDEPGVTAHRLDITDREAVAAFAAGFERVDALIIAAGTNIKERRLHELTPEAWDHVHRREPQRPVLRAARLPRRAAGARGTVVIISSVSGAYTDRSGPAYQAAKAGVIALTHGAGFEVGGEIRCTVILPGVVDTAILDNRPEPPDAETRAQMLHAEDVAAACVFASRCRRAPTSPSSRSCRLHLQAIGKTTSTTASSSGRGTPM